MSDYICFTLYFSFSILIETKMNQQTIVTSLRVQIVLLTFSLHLNERIKDTNKGILAQFVGMVNFEQSIKQIITSSNHIHTTLLESNNHKL